MQHCRPKALTLAAWRRRVELVERGVEERDIIRLVRHHAGLGRWRAEKGIGKPRGFGGTRVLRADLGLAACVGRRVACVGQHALTEAPGRYWGFQGPRLP